MIRVLNLFSFKAGYDQIESCGPLLESPLVLSFKPILLFHFDLDGLFLALFLSIRFLPWSMGLLALRNNSGEFSLISFSKNRCIACKQFLQFVNNFCFFELMREKAFSHFLFLRFLLLEFRGKAGFV